VDWRRFAECARADDEIGVRVLGLDPGTQRAGYCLIESLVGMPRPAYLECGTLELDAPDRVSRLYQLAVDAEDLIAPT